MRMSYTCLPQLLAQRKWTRWRRWSISFYALHVERVPHVFLWQQGILTVILRSNVTSILDCGLLRNPKLAVIFLLHNPFLYSRCTRRRKLKIEVTFNRRITDRIPWCHMQECTRALSVLVQRERHKMKQKTDKTILIINAILFILFEPVIVVSRYMTCALFETIKTK